MVGIIGIVVVFVMVFGGYLAAGGKMAIVLKSLPYELAIIGGAGIGAFLISNDLNAVKQTAKDIGKVFKGPKWKPADYRMCRLGPIGVSLAVGCSAHSADVFAFVNAQNEFTGDSRMSSL